MSVTAASVPIHFRSTESRRLFSSWNKISSAPFTKHYCFVCWDKLLYEGSGNVVDFTNAQTQSRNWRYVLLESKIEGEREACIELVAKVHRSVVNWKSALKQSSRILVTPQSMGVCERRRGVQNSTPPEFWNYCHQHCWYPPAEGKRWDSTVSDRTRQRPTALRCTGDTRQHPSTVKPPTAFGFCNPRKNRSENSFKKKSPPSLMVTRRHDVSGDSATKNQCKELFAL